MTVRGQEAGAVRNFDVVLVLSGGNALGAFEAGVYEALHEHDLRPDWVIGASIGAINAALIAGSDADRRIETMRAFWRPALSPGALTLPWASMFETSRRTTAVGWSATAGRPGIFGPLLSAFTPWTDDQPSIFETNQLAITLKALVDFKRLNAGPCRYTATAVDLETGNDVVFDSTAIEIKADHIRASAALPVAFPPVEIDGRWLVDGGLSANLPLDPVLSAPPPRATLCIAVDLLPLHGPKPATIGEAASRMQDLIFAAQSRRSIDRWKAAYIGREGITLSLVRLAYTEQDEEVAGKALDFSAPTVEQRWSAGYRAGMLAVKGVQTETMLIGVPGFNVIELERSTSLGD